MVLGNRRCFSKKIHGIWGEFRDTLWIGVISTPKTERNIPTMSDTNHTATPVETANEVVTAEVKVAQISHSDHPADHRRLSPAAEKMAEELYKNLSMAIDAYLDMLPHVEDHRIKTDVTAALCYYEKLTGKIKEYHTRTTDLNFSTLDSRSAIDRIAVGVEEAASQLLTHLE